MRGEASAQQDGGRKTTIMSLIAGDGHRLVPPISRLAGVHHDGGLNVSYPAEGATMAGEQNSRINLWPMSGKISASDAEILSDMVSRISLGEATALTPDSVYAAFLEAKKASDAWIKYYMISVALLIMAATGAISELSQFGAKISASFIEPAAILSFSVCTLVYTNHELKMRLFRSFFDGRLAAMDGPDRAEILLRYPLAFYGAKYLPFEARPKGFTVGFWHIFTSLPALVFAALGWLLAVYGLMALLFYALYSVYAEPALPLLIKGAVFAGFFGSLILSGTMLRKASARHVYEGGA
jgi:hypothetical protein